MKRHVVVVPALNEADTITELIRELHRHGHEDIIVVDNASADRTGAIAAAAGADVISEPRRGYGYACAAGSRAAIERETDAIVYIDADLSSDPAEIAGLLKALQSADLVLGSRELGRIEGGAMPRHQRIGNRVSARLMRLLYRADVTDLGPFRAIRADLFKELRMTEMTFGWPTEMTVKSLRRRAAVVEIPVSWRRRKAGQSKVGGTAVGSAKAGFHIIRVTLRHSRR